jgi:putative drug exporter of the RND superfamily
MQLQEIPRDAVATESAAAGVAGVAGDEKLHTHGLYRLGFNYGHLIYRLRWLVIALWVVGLAVSVPFAAQLTSKLTGGGYSMNDSESVQVGNILVDRLHAPPSTLLIAFHSESVAVSDPAYQAQINRAADAMRGYAHVTSVTDAGPGSDGKTTYLAVNFDKNSDYVEGQVSDIMKILPSDGPAKLYLTGSPAIYAQFTEITQHDAERAEMFALPVALLVLLVVFGSLLAALTPLTLALVAVPVAMAIIYPLAAHNQMSVFVLNIATIVGLGISIDYSLFMTRRFREELARGRSVRDAIAWTVSTAGEAILFSGLTVIIGFAGMLLIGIQFMTSIGLGGMCVVAAAVLAALTLLPALLSVLGHRVNALRVPLIGKLVARRSDESDEHSERRGFWHGWALAVMRRPLLIIAGVCVVLLALAWPIFSINIGTPTASSLPKDASARQGIELINNQFPNTTENPVYIIAQTPDGSAMLTPYNLARLDDLSQWLAGRAHVTGVTSLTMLPPTTGTTGTSTLPARQLIELYASGAYTQSPELASLVHATTDKDVTLITVNTNAPVDSAAGKALIDDLRNHYGEGADGLTMRVGGFQAVSLDFNRFLYGNFPKAIAFILGATFLLLLLMFRSLLLPLKAVIMNVLSVTAAYGVLVFVFQEGHFSDLLGFTSNGFIDSTVPILLFCILFGLSMDYEVFLLSRIREEWLRTHNNRYAVARGLEKTGGVITNAALLFIIVAGAFIFTGIVIMKETGLGMTLAVLVDATIIRTLLVPATMRLLGRWNWWLPGRKLPVEQPV